MPTFNNVTPNAYQTSLFDVVIGSPYDKLNQYVLSATSPSFELSTRELYTNNSPVPYPGNINRKTVLTIEFILDEFLHSYRLLWDWFDTLKDTNSPEADAINARADISVIMTDSTKTRTVGEFLYANAWPTNLPSIVLTYENRGTSAEVLSISFECDYIEFIQNIPYFETESHYAPQ